MVKLCLTLFITNYCRYGDKTPSTILGRLFAILWILIGITLFNMFTATITSALNKELLDKVTYTPIDQTVRITLKLAKKTLQNW